MFSFGTAGRDNKPKFRRLIRYLVKRYDTNFLAFFETHAAGSIADRICPKLVRVDAQGRNGEVWFLWRNSSSVVAIVNFSNQFIHASVDFREGLVHLFAVYAASSLVRRRDLWDELENIMSGISEPLFIGGDFNTIAGFDERMGSNGRLSPDSLEFGDWTNKLSLVDLGFKGQRYTWFRGRDPVTRVAKRLDRVLCCAQGRLRWQEASVTHALFMSSDHAALHFQLSLSHRCNADRWPFQFKAAWLRHEALLSASWNSALSTPEALNQLRGSARRLIEQAPNRDLLRKEAEIEKEVDLILEQEEVLWYQKSREKWIDSLCGEDGRWEKDEVKLEDMATGYFQKLYSLEEFNMVLSLPRSRF
ncbi:LOW QUALITY PROTEIN: hypothetical protein V2J09_021024 [Rumex salicifolius]